MIDRYGPFGRATGLRQMMDRLLEDAFVVPHEGGGEGWSSPTMDVYEEGDNLVVAAELPGLKPEDIDVRVEQGVLTITGRTEAEEEWQERRYLLRERRGGRFSRGLRLPAAYNADACQATFERGMLRLSFPKTEEAKPRRIPIAGGSQRVIEGEKRESR